jgi:hypothetical protein
MKENISNTDNYIPYGEEWKKELMKWRKSDLIELLKNTLIKSNDQIIAQAYAKFCIECDRKNLKLLCFSDWLIKYSDVQNF